MDEARTLIDVGKRIDSFQERRRNWGLPRTLFWYLMHLLSKLGIRVHYVRVAADMYEILGNEIMPEVPAGYDTRVVAIEELRPYVGLVPDLDLEFLESAAARGDFCTANFYGRELIGFAFSTYTRARVSKQLDVLVPAGFRYGYKAWTHPDHRRLNLSRLRGYVRRRSMTFVHDRRSIHYIETHNYASLLHSYRHPRERSLPMGFIGWITVFGRQIPFRSRRAKWIGIEFVPKGADVRRQYVR